MKLNQLIPENEGFSPEEYVVHDLTAGLSIDDPVEVDFTEIFLLWLKVASFKDPEREVSV